MKLELNSIWQTLGPFTSLQITQFCSFLWLSNIPLYIYDSSSLSIHLLILFFLRLNKQNSFNSNLIRKTSLFFFLFLNIRNFHSLILCFAFFFTHTHCILFLQEINRLTPSFVNGWPQQKQQWLQLPNTKHTHTMS